MEEEPSTIDDRPSEAATVLERPARLPSSSASSATDTRGSSGTRLVRSPADAVRADEMARSRALAVVGMVGGVACVLTSPLFADSFAALLLLVVGAVLLATTNAYLYWVARAAERFTERRLMGIWVIATTGVLCIVFVFGPFSAAAAALVLGIYVSARNASRRVARATYLTVAIAHVPMAVATVVLELSDVIVVDAAQGPVVVVLAEGLLQLVFFGTYAAATSSQRTMLAILGELEGAIRRVARREVQLDEARQDLARRAPVGAEGRLTGIRLGSYELGVLIGRGGMGEVYEGAPITGDGPPAAVKVLLPEALEKEQSVLRFLREAKAASRCESPHVVRVLETGEPPAEHPYIAMERLHGTDLSSHLRRLDGLMPRSEVVELVRQVGLGLTATVDAGIVHRDIKPQNLFRATERSGPPTWKILDFGVSKLAGHGGTLTRDHLLGTPSYMAPEQALLEDVDGRADLYGLGAVAYRCLVGWPPFSSGDTAKTVYRVVHRMPPRPSAHTELPPEVDLVLAIALAKEPDDRFADAAELAAALAAALEGRVDARHAERARALLATKPWSR